MWRLFPFLSILISFSSFFPFCKIPGHRFTAPLCQLTSRSGLVQGQDTPTEPSLFFQPTDFRPTTDEDETSQKRQFQGRKKEKENKKESFNCSIFWTKDPKDIKRKSGGESSCQVGHAFINQRFQTHANSPPAAWARALPNKTTPLK